MSHCFSGLLQTTLLVGLLGACAADPSTAPYPLTTVPTLDIQRYLGRWYEIAKYPNWFQRKCVKNTSADYSLNPDRSVRVTNQCKSADGHLETAQGEARQIGEALSPKLEVRFAPAWLSVLPFVWGNYWVIDLDADYSLVAVSEPQRDYLWIMSRTPKAKATAYQNLIQRLEAKGFDSARLELTLQD